MSAQSAYDDASLSGSGLSVDISICASQDFVAAKLNHMRLESAKRRLLKIQHSCQIKKRKFPGTVVDNVKLVTKLVNQGVFVHACSSITWISTKHVPPCAPNDENSSP